MYKIIDNKNNIKTLQSYNLCGLNYLAIYPRSNFICYKNKMIYLNGIYMPKTNYNVKYYDIKKFIDYNPQIHDVSDVIDVDSIIIKNDVILYKTINNKTMLHYNEYETTVNDDIIRYKKLTYYETMIILYSYYLMNEVEPCKKYVKIINKLDKFLTKYYWR